jgi:hypothetical protein
MVDFWSTYDRTTQWGMDNEQWTMDNGQLTMDNGEWGFCRLVLE